MIQTDRLVLRRWIPEDLTPYHQMCSDPEVMRYIGAGSTLSREQCAASIERFERAWDTDGTSVLAATLHETGAFIGFVGLAVPEYLPEILPAVELGWRLARDQWGQGLGTEGATAALKWGFDNQRLHRIVSIIQVGNTASRRVAEKLDMALDRELTHPELGLPLWIYAKDRTVVDLRDTSLAAERSRTQSRSSS